MSATVLLLPAWGTERYGVYAAAVASFSWLTALVFTGPEKTVLKLLPRATRTGPLITEAFLAVLWWLPMPLVAAYAVVLVLDGGGAPVVYIGVATMMLCNGCTLLLAVAVAGSNLLWLAVVWPVVTLTDVATTGTAQGEVVVWVVLLASRAPSLAALIWASYLLENTDARAPRVTGVAAVVGLATTAVTGWFVVPALGGAGCGHRIRHRRAGAVHHHRRGRAGNRPLRDGYIHRPGKNGVMTNGTMLAWEVGTPGPIGTHPLRAVRRPVPAPGPGELLVRVTASAVCRTDLHLAEGDLVPRRPGTVPGHEVVGEVTALGDRVSGWRPGDKAGIAWLRYTCGTCEYCRRGSENLCPNSRYTGWDADGGYAQYATVPAGYAYHLPGGYPDVELAPLLCAGIIGYRALRRADLPAGGRLGIYGFGASAHLTAQVAIGQGARVHVFTRAQPARELALRLGATSATGATDPPPEPLDAAILFAPAGDLVPVALAALAPGGTLAIAGIHLSGVPPLDYQRHLFQERNLRSVTANTREDGRALLAHAAAHRLRVATTPYPLDRADQALADLAADRVNGAAVLLP